MIRSALTCLTGLIVVHWCAERVSAAVIRVPADYATLQEAIFASSDYDTVLVAPGLHAGDGILEIGGRSLTLLSESGAEATVLGEGTRLVILECPSVTVDGFTLSTSGHANFPPVRFGAGSLTIRNCRFTSQDNLDIVIRGYEAGILNLHYNLFTTNHQSAILLTTDDIVCHFTNNTIDGGSGNGLTLYGQHSVVENNIIVNLPGYAVTTLAPGDVIGYNNLWNNGVDYAGLAVPGPGALSSDPLFVDPLADDYTLQGNSPCINAGNPSPAYYDPGGSRNDMGAFPFPCFLSTDSADCDRDSVMNVDDNCPAIPNALQQDSDADGLGDACDNCPFDFNPGQADSNGNGMGDLCDCECDRHGDPGENGISSDMLDAIAAINIAFGSGAVISDPNPFCPVSTTDVDCSGATNLLDVVKIISVAFRGATPATEYCDPCP